MELCYKKNIRSTNEVDVLFKFISDVFIEFIVQKSKQKYVPITGNNELLENVSLLMLTLNK